ncbi:hypothetical protein INR49_024812 [Caranx melampygus]|nr:hypothetical protein INR49_024812 [Caranx melampygus]
MSQSIAQQWMKRRGGGGAGAVTEFLNFLAAGQGDHRTQQARKTRRCTPSYSGADQGKDHPPLSATEQMGGHTKLTLKGGNYCPLRRTLLGKAHS